MISSKISNEDRQGTCSRNRLSKSVSMQEKL